MEDIYLAITKYDSERIKFIYSDENSKELIDSFQDDWSLGLNVSFSIPIYSGNSLSMQQQQTLLSKQHSEY